MFDNMIDWMTAVRPGTTPKQYSKFDARVVVREDKGRQGKYVLGIRVKDKLLEKLNLIARKKYAIAVLPEADGAFSIAMKPDTRGYMLTKANKMSSTLYVQLPINLSVIPAYPVGTPSYTNDSDQHGEIVFIKFGKDTNK